MKFAHKITFALAGLVLAYGLISAVLLTRLAEERLQDEQMEWASALTAAMAEGIVRDTLNGDALLVRETLRNVVRSEELLAYAYVVNFEGRLFAHSFDRGFPRALSGLKRPEGKAGVLLATADGNVLDVSQPLVRGTDARLHLGVSLAGPERLVSDLQQAQLLIFIGVGLIGLVLAFYLGRQLGRPLDQLVEALRAFGRGQPLGSPDLTGAGQEVRELGQAFRNMIADRARLDAALQRAHDELETQVRARTAQLRASNDELEAFAYSVSHDLRAPLRAIDGFSRILAEDYFAQLDAEAHNHLARIRQATQRMGRLIDELLELSRVGRAEMRMTDVDLARLAHEVVAQLRVGETGRAVEVTITPIPAARGDERLLWLVLENLLGNAWKYTRPMAAACIELGATTQNGETVYCIRDNGIGFDMRYADKLFGVFQRLHRLDEFEGSGVGLATVARIVARHGGRVWAEGRVGAGASFFFTLAGPVSGPEGQADTGTH